MLTASSQPSLETRPPLIHRAGPAILRRLLLIFYRLRYSRANFGARCDIRPPLHLVVSPGATVRFGEECILDRDLTIESTGSLTVGARTIFGHHCTLAAKETLIIGSDCLIAELVSIRDHDHRFDRLDVPTRDQGAVTALTVIGNNVWLGSKVTVLKGVTIGDNAIVGANAVVTRDIPANAIAVGIPAKVIRTRTP